MTWPDLTWRVRSRPPLSFDPDRISTPHVAFSMRRFRFSLMDPFRERFWVFFIPRLLVRGTRIHLRFPIRRLLCSGLKFCLAWAITFLFTPYMIWNLGLAWCTLVCSRIGTSHVIGWQTSSQRFLLPHTTSGVVYQLVGFHTKYREVPMSQQHSHLMSIFSKCVRI